MAQDMDDRQEEPLDEPRLNLRALDPMEDPPHWHSVVASTMARVDAVLAARTAADDPLDLIARWRRPLLVAAAAAVALLIPAEIALERREARTERVERLVEISTGWSSGKAPAVSDFLRAIGAESPGAGEAP